MHPSGARFHIEGNKRDSDTVNPYVQPLLIIMQLSLVDIKARPQYTLIPMYVVVSTNRLFESDLPVVV